MKARKLILLVATAALLLSAMATAATAQEVNVTEATDGVRATVVVLVDESGSLSEPELAEEVRAVRMLTGVPGIDVYVAGFASEGTLPAWEIVCEPGDAGAICTESLALRTNAQGNDTDHAAALAAADFVFNRPGAVIADTKIVLMMTDGQFDPNGSGAGPEDWARLEEAQARLRATGAEVWPLGFGAADQADLDRLATSGSQSCSDPHGVIVESPEALLSSVNEIFTSATCNPVLVGDLLDVSEGSQSVTLWFQEDELPNGEVTIDNESTGQSLAVACALDSLTGLWTCEIPTDEIGPGNWAISPPPLLNPYIEPKTPTPPPAPTTSVPSENTTTTTVAAVVFPPTTVPTVIAAETASFPWLLALGGLLALGALFAALLLRRPKLDRGVVAVRMAGQSEWSAEETVRAEKRQAFEVDPDNGYPSIETTTLPAADVILEASSKGVHVSGSMVEKRSRMRIGDEIELLGGMNLIYARALEDDLDDDFDIDEDLYEDTFI